jgi:uncharacterized caspase-like protein
MLLNRTLLVCFCVTWIWAQPQQPQQPPPKQQRDLRIEKIEKDGGEPPAPKSVHMPEHSYAVVIGLNNYKNPAVTKLRYAEPDAQLMNTILANPEGGNFKAENVHLLTNEKATLANVRKEIDVWLPGIAKENDRVLIYFAGHGLIDRASGKGYLAPYDIDPKNIAATGFPMDELGQVIGGKIHAKSKILLTDACHSGAITPEDTESVNQGLVKMNSSLFSMTASRDREQSVEDPYWGGGHGVFTWYVAQGMGGQADISPRDGEVTADELAEYVRTQVRKDTEGKQNPTSEKGSFDPNMLPACRRRPKPGAWSSEPTWTMSRSW